MDFDAIITGIRKAIYGREVREYIASSMEWTRDFVNQSIANIKELLRQAEAQARTRRHPLLLRRQVRPERQRPVRPTPRPARTKPANWWKRPRRW